MSGPRATPVERGDLVRVGGVQAKAIVARQEWGCALCGRTIEPGQLYLYVERFYPERVCLSHEGEA